MKKQLLSLLFSSIVLLVAFPFQAAKAEESKTETTPSPVGFWKTIDDKDHQPRSIVKIWEENNQLQGKIVKVFYKEGESEKDLCTECEGEDKDKPILGMTILKGFSHEEASLWTGGTILDPKNGHVYKSRLILKDNDTLDVRGYIGLPLIGRSQTWERVEFKK